MDEDEIVEQLTAVDVPEDQARLYVELLRLGASKARPLSERCGFSRSKTYRLLGKMSERGFVTASVTEPRVYTPVQPDELLDRLRTRWERGVDRVETVRDRVTPSLEAIRGSQETRDDPSWNVVEGRADLLDRMMDLYESAETSAHVISSHGMCTNFTPPVRQCWQAALDSARDGAELRGIVDCGPDARRRIAELTADVDAQIRTMTPGRQVHFLVVDDERALMYLDQAPQTDPTVGDDVAIISDTSGLVDSLTMFFEMCWTRAQPLRGYDQVQA